MPEHLFIELLESHPEFLILLPDLWLIHFVVVGDFGHVFEVLGVALERRSGDIGEVGATGGAPVLASGVHKL